MSAIPYLFKSPSGIYYARLVVPHNLRSKIGKTELRQSLRTRDKKLAISKAWEVLPVLKISLSNEAQLVDSVPSMIAIQNKISPCNQTEIQSPQKPIITLSNLVDKFTRDKQLNGWSATSERHHKAVFNEIIQVLGNIDITLLERSHALKYRDFVLSSKLSIGTINKRFCRLQSLLEYGSINYGIKNWGKGLTIKDKAKDKDKRNAVSKTQIRTLFKYLNSNTKTGNRPNRYWIPLLAAYTGARAGELAQLYISDIEIIKGLPCIKIQASHSDQTLKNKHSERIISIHSELIKLGFLKFIDT